MRARGFRSERAFAARVCASAFLVAVGGVACGSESVGPGGGINGTSGSGAGSTAGTPGAGGATGGNGTAGGATGGAVTGGAGGNGTAGGGGGGDVGERGITPLYGPDTMLEPEVVVDTPTALKTYWSDRARDRHAREARFNAYEHYLHIYWEKRTAEVEIIDTVGKDPDDPEGGSVTFNVKAQWKLDTNQAELRFFFRGIGTVAEYHDNRPMTMVGNVDDFTYTRTVTTKMPEMRKLQVGDKMEFELSQFLDKNYRAAEFTGRDNYYGTTMLYVVGKGLVPWAQTGEVCLNEEEEICRDSEMIPEEAWLGGHTTMHEIVSGEPESAFLQMAANLAPKNGQVFVRGRRTIHTNFDDGHHDESEENPYWTEQANKLGPLFINHSCNKCHTQNSRAVPPGTGTPLTKYVFKVGTESGAPDPMLGEVLQPADNNGEPNVSISAWTEVEGGLRKPTFAFAGGNAPTHYSPRISPQLVGMGLLEAIPESEILKLADEGDANGDGISGAARLLVDPENPSLLRLGRFGWKAGQASVRHQVAGALKTDMGVLTSVFPTPDCGSAQQNCGASTAEFSDADLNDASAYMSLLSVRAQRNWAAPDVIKGKELFTSTGCASCHTPTFKTSPYAPHAELRNQTIHPYTDLLLHDMGPGLADTLPEGTRPEGGNASYLEWRTPPLWGIGFTKATAGEEGYLHDGRARTLTEAILWHGGEGEKSQKAFVALPEADKNALLAFLKSL